MFKMERISVLHSLIFWSDSSQKSLAKYGHVSVATFPVFILEFFRRIYHHHHNHHRYCCHWYKLKLKLSPYVPGQTLRAAPRISRQPAHDVGIVLSPKDQPPLHPGDIPQSSQGHSKARRIKSTTNSNIAIGNGNRDLKCSAATNCATAPPLVITDYCYLYSYFLFQLLLFLNMVHVTFRARCVNNLVQLRKLTKGAQVGRGDWCDWMQSCLRNGDAKAHFT